MIIQLQSMLMRLKEYKSPKEDLMKRHVAARLDKSYEQYQKEIDYSLSYLERKHEKSIMKRLNNDKTYN